MDFLDVYSFEGGHASVQHWFRDAFCQGTFLFIAMEIVTHQKISS